MGKGSYMIEKGSAKHEMKMLRLDASKAKALLGWKPKLGIDKTLEWTFEWYGSYYSKKDDAGKLATSQIEEFFGR